jgi:hypothetical protein
MGHPALYRADELQTSPLYLSPKTAPGIGSPTSIWLSD